MTDLPVIHPPLQIEGLSFQYARRSEPAISDISLQLNKGELVLLAGSSGCGKTTLMRCINGLIPRTYHGTKTGLVFINGIPVDQLSMVELSGQVGTILQDPERQIVSSHVFNEISFGLENLSVPRDQIIEKVNQTLDYLGVAYLRDRETFQLSGGEKQKVALAGVLAMNPGILILDEPLASLDPASAHEALRLFRKMTDDGVSILLVEHRVEDVLTIHPDRVIYMDSGRILYNGSSQGLVEIADYRKVKLPAQVVMRRAKNNPMACPEQPAPRSSSRPIIEFQQVEFRYRADLLPVLSDIDLTVTQGDVIAILGPNGAGKTTLVKHALGLLQPTRGAVFLEGKDTRRNTVSAAAHTIGYVFQSPTQMLFAQTVQEELEFGPRNLRQSPGVIAQNVDWALETVHLEEEKKSAPLALSFGQQKRISIAAVLAMRSRVLMMDEPTAGQDYWNYMAFMDSIVNMSGFDAVLFITHDLDLALIYANRVILLSDGRIAADGPPEEVLSNEERLRNSRVLPTSLLETNLQMLPRTGRFLRAEMLANWSQ